MGRKGPFCEPGLLVKGEPQRESEPGIARVWAEADFLAPPPTLAYHEYEPRKIREAGLPLPLDRSAVDGCLRRIPGRKNPKERGGPIENGGNVEEVLLNTNEMEWQEMDGYPSGTMVKVLKEDGETRTLLMKIPPGFHLDPHCHITCEQHFILEGGYETSGWKFGPGTYHYLPARRLHGPWDSKEGAVILVICEGREEAG
jgi:hypothetical protein